jgi:hypothetical protein
MKHGQRPILGGHKDLTFPALAYRRDWEERSTMDRKIDRFFVSS